MVESCDGRQRCVRCLWRPLTGERVFEHPKMCFCWGVCDLCFMKVSSVRWALGTESSVKLVLPHVPLTRLGQTDFCIDQILMDSEGLSGPYSDLLQDLFDPTKKGPSL